MPDAASPSMDGKGSPQLKVAQGQTSNKKLAFGDRLSRRNTQLATAFSYGGRNGSTAMLRNQRFTAVLAGA